MARPNCLRVLAYSCVRSRHHAHAADGFAAIGGVGFIDDALDQRQRAIGRADSASAPTETFSKYTSEARVPSMVG